MGSEGGAQPFPVLDAVDLAFSLVIVFLGRASSSSIQLLRFLGMLGYSFVKDGIEN